MIKRFFLVIGAAVVWSTVIMLGLTMGWTLVGAGLIGILGTVGCHPPTRGRLILVLTRYQAKLEC